MSGDSNKKTHQALYSVFVFGILLIAASCKEQFQDSRVEVITPPIDITAEEIQRSVEEGHQPWRYEASWVACVEIDSVLEGHQKQKTGLDLNNCLRKSELREEDTKAVVAIHTKNKLYKVYLNRFMKPQGIWTPTKIEIREP